MSETVTERDHALLLLQVLAETPIPCKLAPRMTAALVWLDGLARAGQPAKDGD